MKAETVCSKLDQTMKVLEKKLEDHQANIQAMKDELSVREEETQVFTPFFFLPYNIILRIVLP